MKRLFAILALMTVLPLLGNDLSTRLAPTSPLTVTTVSSRITYMRLVNDGGGTSVYCTIADRSTNCSGAGCELFKATFSADPQTYSDAQPQGTLAAGGFTITCSATGVTIAALQYQNAIP